NGQQHVGRFLLHRDAVVDRLRRELGRRFVYAVVDVDIGEVEVGADFERAGQNVAPVAGGFRGHVDHVLGAVDFGFDVGSDRFLDGLRVRAGIVDFHLDGRRRDLRVLGDGQRENADAARNEDDERDDDGKNGTVNEELCHSYFDLVAYPFSSVAGCVVGDTTMPGLTFCRPSATTRSPAFTPSVTM